MNYQHYFAAAAKATSAMALLSEERVNAVLHAVADAVAAKAETILIENKKDLERMNPGDPKFDRLQLTADRIIGMAGDVRGVAALKSPPGEIISTTNRPNGLKISKVRVPLGVIGIIYEARPNVTLDVFALCFKTGNVCLLKGGSDAAASNRALITIIHDVLKRHGLDTAIADLLPPEREATDALLGAVGFVDVLIPRGSQHLIDHVRKASCVPVIETGAGIVHTYFDKDGDLTKGRAIIANAKTRRVSVCNALDCLIVHRERLDDLARLVSPLAESGVTLFADAEAYTALQQSYQPGLLHKAVAAHFGTEFLSLKMAVKTVDNFAEALEHIALYSSKHSEAIITENKETAQQFIRRVDAAAVYTNASTAFTDGGQFGLGAEIGISTQKLHARGPMGLQELTSYKWIVQGEGQTRV